MSRRQVLAAMAVLCGGGSAGAKARPDSRRDRWMAEWMRQWESSLQDPVGALFLSRFKDPVYFLTQSIGWTNRQKSGRTVTVPSGFVTDLASTPQVFWSILRPDGEYVYPAIIHDYLYWTQPMPRADADALFLEGMEDFGISAVKRSAIYEAVRHFGGSSWADNARLRSGGEKRILKRFPSDPRTTWATWKRMSDVFAD